MAVQSPPPERWEERAEFRDHPLAAVLKVTRAPHAESPEAGYDELIRHCGAVFGDRPGPHYLAHFGTGFFDFSLDVFEHEACRSRYGGRTPAGLRADHQSGCRHLVISAERFDRQLADLKSGDLMRTVLVAGDGALSCLRLRPGQYLVGATLHPSSADEMDRLTWAATATIRAELYGLPGEIPGGTPAAVPGPFPVHEHGGEAPHDGLTGEFARLARQAVDPGDLHYVALFRGWTFAASADVLDAPDLAQWFHTISRETRRKLYERLGGDMRQELAWLAHAVRAVISLPIDRLVLDVQEGALYVHRLAEEGDLLIGVTLDQRGVSLAEQRLRDLAGRLRDGA